MFCSLKDGLIDTMLLSGSFRRDFIRTSQGHHGSVSGLLRRKLIGTSLTEYFNPCLRR